VAGGVPAGVRALDGQVRLPDRHDLLVEAGADLDGVTGVGGVDRGLDGVEDAAVLAIAGLVAVGVLVDDQDASMGAAGPCSASRDCGKADGGDDRQQQHCSTSLHGQTPPGENRVRTSRARQSSEL
jgi:hypothetical protein